MSKGLKKKFGKQLTRVLSFFLAFAIAAADIAPVAYAIDGSVNEGEAIIITDEMLAPEVTEEVPGQVQETPEVPGEETTEVPEAEIPEGIVIDEGATVVINGEEVTDASRPEEEKTIQTQDKEDVP